MTLPKDTWDELADGAESAGDLGRKAAYTIAAHSFIADYIQPSDLIVTPGRTVIDWDNVGKGLGYRLGETADFLIAFCTSLDRSSETLAGYSLRKLWDLDRTQRGIVLMVLQRFLVDPETS